MATWRSVMSRAFAPPDVGPPSENTVLLQAALRTLPANQRQAIALYYLFDLSIEQIALETDAAEGTVKSWLSRGRAALAAQLSEKNVVEATDVR